MHWTRYRGTDMVCGFEEAKLSKSNFNFFDD